MAHYLFLRPVTLAVLVFTALSLSSCSQDDDSDKDKGGKSSISGQPGKGSLGGGGRTGSGGSSGQQPAAGSAPGEESPAGGTPGVDTTVGNGGVGQPGSSGDSGNSGNGNGNSGAQPGGGAGTEPTPPPGAEPVDPEEEAVYEMLTQVFMSYLPLGTYTGKSDNGTACSIKVAPFTTPGKDLLVEMEISGGSDGAPNDKITFTLSTKLGGTLVGAPKENPPLLRMWVEVAVPTMTMTGARHAITMLNVKFDPATKKAESIYIFDQTREGLANTAANCFVGSFSPAPAPTN